MMNSVEIILPERIPILREQPKQDIKVKNEEFSLYFKNFIFPIYPWQDIIVDCKYGKNLGFCWRICEYPADVDEFNLTIKIINEYGECVAEKKTVIELYDQNMTEPFNILCVGDSMTHHTTYVSHMQNRLKNVFTRGVRSFDGHVFHEGRAGWSYRTYFAKNSLKVGERGACSWVSPFLFPKGVEAENYYGDMEFYEASQEENRSTCCFNGFECKAIEEGQVYHDKGKLYQYGMKEAIVDVVEWEFSFKKYLLKNKIADLNAVSILLGANDLFPFGYEETEKGIKQYVENAKRFVAAVKEADEGIDVIINLPVCGSEQVAWGEIYGCLGTEKSYSYKIRMASKELIETFDKQEGIYICPMLCCFDTEHNFDKSTSRANLYCNEQIERKNDGIHPNDNGYRQMGDALAGMVEKLRHKTEYNGG